MIIRHDADASQYLADETLYPAVLSLKWPGDMCAATLVAPCWLVTCAHAMHGLEAQLENVEVLGYARQHIELERIFRNPAFGSAGGDIALIKLSTPVTNVPPVHLYEGPDDALKDKIATFVGHGQAGTGDTVERRVLDFQQRAAKNKVVSADISSRELVFKFEHPDDAACCVLEGVSGPGDSGGPALVEDEHGAYAIVGISSYQHPIPPTGLSTYGAVEHYTSISAWAEWMHGVMAADASGTAAP